MAGVKRNIKQRGIRAEYFSWLNMKDRCYRTTHKQYKDYGGRNITVCKRWLDSFEDFLFDVGRKPTPISPARKDEYSLDRVDNSKPYEPGNCKWSLRPEQMANRRGSHFIIYNGESHSIRYWSEKTGIAPTTLINRMTMGWPTEKALTEPVINNKTKNYFYKKVDHRKTKFEKLE